MWQGQVRGKEERGAGKVQRCGVGGEKEGEREEGPMSGGQMRWEGYVRHVYRMRGEGGGRSAHHTPAASLKDVVLASLPRKVVGP